MLGTELTGAQHSPEKHSADSYTSQLFLSVHSQEKQSTPIISTRRGRRRRPQGYLRLHSEFEASLGAMRPCLEQTNTSYIKICESKTPFVRVGKREISGEYTVES